MSALESSHNEDSTNNKLKKGNMQGSKGTAIKAQLQENYKTKKTVEQKLFTMGIFIRLIKAKWNNGKE